MLRKGKEVRAPSAHRSRRPGQHGDSVRCCTRRQARIFREPSPALFHAWQAFRSPISL
jgi:hypothetical protein